MGPEYGGDGDIIGRCDQFKNPEIGFPGHWAPNDLVFYEGDAFPERYKNGAFIASSSTVDLDIIKEYAISLA